MSVSRKIFLIALSFSLPIAVLVYLTVINIDSNITFAQWELKGDKYQRPLEDLLQNLQGVQILFNTDQASLVPQCAAKIDAAFQHLEEMDARYGVELQFTDEGLAKRGRGHQRVKNVHREWKDLTVALSSSGTSASGINAKFDHLSADIRTMITHMGDTSNLILDPDLDSYYLMDVTLLALPQTQDRLAQAVQYGYASLKRGTPTGDEKIKLAVFAAMLQEADVDRVTGSSQTSVNEDLNFYGASVSLQNRLPAGLAKYQQANAPFIKMIQGIVAGNAAGIAPEAFLQSGLQARQASFEYWNTAVDEEDVLLGKRIAYFDQRRMTSLLLAFLAVLAAATFAFFLTRSITRPLVGVVGSLGPGAVLLSVCVERISEASRNKFSDPDETSLICQELNANCDSMRKAAAELESQVVGAHRS